jgi:hypothetical protein
MFRRAVGDFYYLFTSEHLLLPALLAGLWFQMKGRRRFVSFQFIAEYIFLVVIGLGIAYGVALLAGLVFPGIDVSYGLRGTVYSTVLTFFVVGLWGPNISVGAIGLLIILIVYLRLFSAFILPLVQLLLGEEMSAQSPTRLAREYAFSFSLLAWFFVFSAIYRMRMIMKRLSKHEMTLKFAIIMLGLVFALSGFLLLDTAKAILWLFFFVLGFPLLAAYLNHFFFGDPLPGSDLALIYKQGVSGLSSAMTALLSDKKNRPDTRGDDPGK